MHNVGDIVFVISNKRRTVFPVQIVEQVIRKTLAGEEISYKALMPGNDKIQPVDLQSLDGTVHTSLQTVRELLFKQAVDAIDGLLETAQELCDDHFVTHKSHEQIVNSIVESVSEVQLPTASKKKTGNGASKIKVQLADGTSANVTLPDV